MPVLNLAMQMVVHYTAAANGHSEAARQHFQPIFDPLLATPGALVTQKRPVDTAGNAVVITRHAGIHQLILAIVILAASTTD